MAAIQVATAPPPTDSAVEPASNATTEQLSLEEMLRIMDVASELRKERELVHQQLNIDQTKELLRERLLAAARVTGEPLTAEQIDFAIENYFDKLHSFEKPEWSWSLMMAHLYVRRMTILGWLCGVGALAAAWTFFG